jgi:leucyl/phenylalanyl-tRNA--protein transferase
MRGCAEGRPVWISEEFVRIYGGLHRAGKAHSVEVWLDGVLVGGVYGVRLGRAFFAESMFHRVRDMSKVALAHLIENLRDTGAELLDVQYLTPHLACLGVVDILVVVYQKRLRDALPAKPDQGPAIR